MARGRSTKNIVDPDQSVVNIELSLSSQNPLLAKREHALSLQDHVGCNKRFSIKHINYSRSDTHVGFNKLFSDIHESL
jgi:hypothetical protein